MFWPYQPVWPVGFLIHRCILCAGGGAGLVDVSGADFASAKILGSMVALSFNSLQIASVSFWASALFSKKIRVTTSIGSNIIYPCSWSILLWCC